MTPAPNAKWFRRVGFCQCGKPGVGTLMGTRNEELGSYCAGCADNAIKAAEKYRAEWMAKLRELKQ